MQRSDCANVEISGMGVTRRVRAPRSVRHLLISMLLGIVVSVQMQYVFLPLSDGSW
jgi:hypothetical protein